MHASASPSTARGTPSRRGKSPRFTSTSPSQADPSTLSSNFPNKPLNIFASSLDIPVEGATPIEPDSEKDPEPTEPEDATTDEPKRAPRKSKTEALAALDSHTRSLSPNTADREFHQEITAKYRNTPPIPVSPTLDLSTVKTKSPRRNAITHKAPRPFGLENCPEYYPTMEEFKDPMEYIRSISNDAQQYGICKVIPPPEWTMPFVADTQTFRFRTRLQRLNSIEASSRAKLNFLEQLYQFHKQQGNPRVVVPTINHKPLDLWLLRKEVQKLGGYDAVTKGKKWSDLGRILGYRGIPGLSTQIRNSYTRVILPYEHFCERARNLPTTSPVARDPHLKTHNNTQSTEVFSRLNATTTPMCATSPPSSPLTATSSVLSEPPDESEQNEGSRSASTRPRRSTRMGSHESVSPKKPVNGSASQLPVILPPIFYDKAKVDITKGTLEQSCEICHKKNRGEEMLLCDGCDCGFHMFCLDPPLDTVPKEQWFCFTCLAGTGGDFGFDEGEEHSLSSFQARDLEFRRMWFESHQPSSSPVENSEGDDTASNRIGNVKVSEYDVEEEFWRLVQSPHETVEVEYGADVHSTTHGSAMPTMETHPLNLYSKDPWNLNNIPIVSDSLLRFIKSDISGMTVPWIYVGMAFSTFCWHNEDHYTYSINFMHWGETKTWYGIPGDDAAKFEAAIKCEAPDLFEAQPDLLFQLVTLMNPKRVTDAGVRVYACNQRAGEFVITFPKAYHAGFNHGFNFNEAVNFALPDWLPYGRDCVQRYREHRKLPVFSHDELLITITQQSQSIKTAMWLIDSLREMTDREMDQRARSRLLGFPEILEREDRPEDQYQCAVCKTFCYLSQITCPCTSKVVCVDHTDLLCEDRAAHQRTLRKRFSDEELSETLAKVVERGAVPTSWRAKFNKLLLESGRPSLRSLRAVFAEGERINYPLPQLSDLRRFVTRANEWVDAANTFLIRKQSRKRSRRRGRPSLNDAALNLLDDPGDRPDRGLDDLYALLREVEGLGFDCPEVGLLRTLAQSAEEIKAKASALLSSPPEEENRENYLQECKQLLLSSSSVNVLLDEIVEVEKIVDRVQVVKELEEKLEDEAAVLTLEEVRQLLTRARTCNIPPDQKYLKLLEARQRAGDNWEERAKNILAQPVKTIDELDDFADMDAGVPIDPDVLDRLMAARAKAKDFDKQAKAWLSPEPPALKPRVQEVMRLVSRSEKDFSIVSIQDLKRTTEIAIDLETRCDQVLRNRYHSADEDVFETMEQWKAYARDHLRIFSLPTFEKLDTQLKLHNQWLVDLPWYCREHQEAHGQAILDDVLECTNPEDDAPPADEYFTCICMSPVRPPPPGGVSDAVQCDHCYARFHGICAQTGGSCPFCDHHHWNGAIHKERNWHFCYLPGILSKAPDITKHYSEDWKQLEVIVHRVDRLSQHIGQFLSYTSQPTNQRQGYIHQVRHFMRKLYKLQFAVSPNPEVSFGLDLAGLHRILAGRPPVIRPKKRRRPRFTFGQDVDADWTDGTRCICRGRTPYLLNYPTVACESCNKSYHAGCVFYPVESPESARFLCPLCCLRKNRPYPYSDVRVKPIAEENLDVDVYVNVSEMVDTFSKEMIYKQMPPPYSQTLFVELIRFTPGQPDITSTNGATPRAPSSHHSSPRSHASQPGPSRLTQLQHGSPHMHIPVEAYPEHAHPHIPPPPPWSRWGTMSTPGRPPSTHRRQSTSTRSTPQPSSKKRKHADDMSTTEELSRVSSSSSISAGPVPKRRAMHVPPSPLPQPPHPNIVPSPPRVVQSISPSIAKLLAPENVVADDNWARARPPITNGATTTTKSPIMQASGNP